MRSIAFLLAATLALATTNLHAQQIDAMEFGMFSAFAVRAATWIDTHSKECRNESAPLSENTVNFVLKTIGGRSASSVRRGAAMATNQTEAEVKARAVAEAQRTIRDLGGCKSKKTEEWQLDTVSKLTSYLRYLTDVSEMYSNRGDRIFR